MTELSGKVAVVTGGAAGIGREICVALSAAGARVVVADIAGASKVADSLDEALGLALDVSSEEQTAGLADTVLDRFGRLDILVNNAGLFGSLTPGPLTDITVAEWQRVMDVNVLGAFLCTRAVVPAMTDGGCVVNIASTTAFKGVPYLLHYVASKGALLAMTKASAAELGPLGIRVNAVAPGFTVSDGVLDNSEAMHAMRSSAASKRALGREATPVDIVGAVRFFVGPGAGFVTGQTLVVDGGAYLH